MTLLDDLNIRYPIIQAPMAGVSTPALAAAVSVAGALGSLGLGASSVDDAQAQIHAVRDSTDRPFNVNFFCHALPRSNERERHAWRDHLTPYFREQGIEPPEDIENIYVPIDANQAMRDLVLCERPPVVSFHFGVPGHGFIQAIHDYGGHVLICVTSADEADCAVAAGADALVAQGAEAGGHRGNFDADNDAEMGLIPLIGDLLRCQELPVIAAGGLMNGQSIDAVLRLGASAAQLGTAFVGCPESGASTTYRDVLRSARATGITRCISGRPARGVVGPFQTRIGSGAPHVPDYPLPYDAAKQLNAAAKVRGNHQFAPNWAGQGVTLLREKPAAELVSILVQELEASRAESF